MGDRDENKSVSVIFGETEAKVEELGYDTNASADVSSFLRAIKSSSQTNSKPKWLQSSLR